MNQWLSDPHYIQHGLRLGGVGVWRWRIGTDELEWTDNLEQVHRMVPGSFDQTLKSFQRDLHPQDAEFVWQAISKTIETGEPYAVVYRSAGASGSQPLWIEARGGVVTDRNGERYLTGVCLDVTARINNEKELARRFKQQQGIQELGSYALGPVSFADVLQKCVEAAAQIFEAPLTKVLQFVDDADRLKLVAGIGWAPGLVGTAQVGIDRDSQAGFTLISSSPVVVTDLTTETRFSGPQLLRDHGVRSGMSIIIPGSADRPFGVLGVHDSDLRSFDEHDVDALISIANIVAQSARQHEAGEQQRLILREMAHRSGNLLQVATSLASQTFRSGNDPEVALRSFSKRLGSLSRANYLITSEGWGPTRIKSIVTEVLGAYLDRLQIEGRDIRLPAELAFDLALVLNELTTNSIKYGGLSVAQGSINLSWRIEDSCDARNFVMEWNDSQSVAKATHGTGFGRELKRALVEKKWKGRMFVASKGPYRFSCSIPLPETEPSTGAGVLDFDTPEADPQPVGATD